jgi:hypothetical protein
MSGCEVKKILYFHRPGPGNTDNVIHAVRQRVKEGGIEYAVVASVTGQTALKVAEKLKGLGVSVVCVSGSPGWGTYHGVEYPFVKGKVRERLEKLNVSIVDKTPSTLSGDTIDYGLARYGYIPLSWIVAETLEAVGGYGLKTAVEVVLMATDCGMVPPRVKVISIGGSDRGADTSIVAKASYSSSMFSRDSTQRFQISEIIAMPRMKNWYKTIGVGELFIRETEKGEALRPATESM